MTIESKLGLQRAARKVTSNLLLAATAALSTHYLDVVAVKDRVENIRVEQIENSKWRMESQARWKRFDEVDMPTILNGQRVLLRCIYYWKHGEIDRECDWEVWKTQNGKAK